MWRSSYLLQDAVHSLSTLSPLRRLLLVLVVLGLASLLVLRFTGARRSNLSGLRSYAVYYGQGQAEALSAYQLAIVQPTSLTAEERRGLQRSGTKVLAYLSVGEVEPTRPWFASGQVDESWLLGVNEAWGSYHVDIRQEGWQRLLLSIAGTYIEAGFDGLFLDTVDTALLYPDSSWPTVAFIRKLRQTHPKSLIVQNRGLAVAHESAAYIDALMLESVSSTYDFGQQSYRYVERDFEATEVAELGRRAGLPVLSLDYAPVDNPAMAERSLVNARRYGFVPFVSTITLTELPDYGLGADMQPDPRIRSASLLGSGGELRAEVQLENAGLAPAENFTAALYADGELLERIHYATLAPGERLLWEPDGAALSLEVELEVVLETAADAATENNRARLEPNLIAQEPLLPPAEQRRRPPSNGPTLSARALSSNLTIDGDLSDWAGAECSTLSERAQINHGVPEAWTGPEDLSAEICFRWDAGNLYMSADVVDDRLEQRYSGSDLWHGDHVELWVDTQLQLDFDDESESGDDFQFGFSPGNFADLSPEVFLWTPPGPPERYSGRVEYAAAVTERGYRLETRIPASVLLGLRLEPQHAVGVSVAVSDTDTTGGSEQETMLATAPGLKWGQPDTFNTLVLEPSNTFALR